MKNWLIGITPAATAYFNWMLLVINQADLQNFASFEGFATNKLATYFLFTKQLFQVALSCNFNCLHNTTSLRNGRTKINSVSCREICTALKLWADFLKSSVGQETLQHFPPPSLPLFFPPSSCSLLYELNVAHLPLFLHQSPMQTLQF